MALFVDDAHDLHPKTLNALKRLIELVHEGGGQLSIVLIGHPRLKNDLRRPMMEEIGDRTTVFEFGGLRDRQRDYIDWALAASLKEGVDRAAIITDEAATLLAAKLKTPLQIGRHLVRAFEAGFEAGVKPIDQTTVETVLSRQLDDLEPQLTRHGYDLRTLCRAVRRQSHRDPAVAARRSRPGPDQRAHRPDARRRPAGLIGSSKSAPDRLDLASVSPAMRSVSQNSASAARSSLTHRAPETALNLASGRASLRVATHIWSGVGALSYLFRPYQIVRTPRTRAKEPVRS